jgi:hypothetical protein
MRQRVKIGVPLLVLSLIGLRATRADDKGPANATQPLMALTGKKSKVTKGKYRRVESAEAWKALWLEHQTGSPKPREVPPDMPFVEIDFTRCMVIAVFEGKGINCAGFKAHSVTETESNLLLRVSPRGIQSGVPGVDTTAWAVFVLPRSTKPVVIEENVQRWKDRPPVWEKCAELKAGNRSVAR